MPLRLEVGPRDLESKQTVMARRDTGDKIDVPESDITATVLDLLEKIQVRVCFCGVRFHPRLERPISLPPLPPSSCQRKRA